MKGFLGFAFATMASFAIGIVSLGRKYEVLNLRPWLGVRL